MNPIPEPSVERLLILARLLDRLDVQFITSGEIEARTGWSSNTIRKDISYLEGSFASPAGYDREKLSGAIKTALGLDKPQRFCVVGLGRLGSAYLNYPAFAEEGYELVAGFDSSVNRIEILRSPVPLYPAYKMAEVISRFQISLALLCVPPEEAQHATDRLVAAGIKGIINFAPVVLQVPEGIQVRNVNVVDELRAISATIQCS
ncbi:MAG: redox-sensing transcriptional repressor Rex [Treponema sp.]|nr:redox-sensing transcriptional repressor Rex [Treponema sp.]